MEKDELSKIFIDVFQNLSITNRKKVPKIIVQNYDELELTLQQYLVTILGEGIVDNYQNHFPEIRKYFENILDNVDYNSEFNLIDWIMQYAKIFKNTLESHRYTLLFIQAMQRLYSPNYDGKVDFLNDAQNELVSEMYSSHGKISLADIFISNFSKCFIIGRISRKSEVGLPSVYINNIDHFEKILQNYVLAIQESDTYYNLFHNKNLQDISENTKIRALFESTMFNASSKDASFIENFIIKYTSFVTDKTLYPFRTLGYLSGGESTVLQDEVFLMLKRSELEYETPFCFCFMLKNQVVELPNIRLGINTENNHKKAYIIATQSSQSSYINRNNLSVVESKIKKIIPTSSAFRFYNPSHLVAILMCFGILKGMDIYDVEVVDYLPFRYKKTSIDYQMNEEEATNYQRRLTDKAMITYMKLSQIVEGVNIITYPEMDMGLRLDISSDLICANPELQKLYDMCYQYSKNLNYDQENKNSL